MATAPDAPAPSDGAAGASGDTSSADVPSDGLPLLEVGMPGAADSAGEEPPIDGPTAPLCANGATGVRASYYPTRDFSGIPLVRTERGLIHDWADGSPHPTIPGDGFTALFSADLVPEVSDSYTFFVVSDDGFRLWLDGELTLDWWGVTARSIATTTFLEAGRRHSLLIEYFENIGDALLDVTWKRPGTPRTSIPQCSFFETPGAASTCSSAPGTECAPPMTPPCPSTGAGTGLRATYYRWPGFTDVAHTTADTHVFYDAGWVPDPARYTEKFTARWEGTLEAPSSDSYTFFLIADGHAELTIEGQKATTVLDDSTSQEQSVTVSLAGGSRTPIRVDYIDGHEAGWAYLQLRWKSRSIPKGPVPRCRLYPGTP
jgi:hypothetical protein